MASRKFRAGLAAIWLAALGGCVERQQVLVKEVAVTPRISEASLTALTRYRLNLVPPKLSARLRRDEPERREEPEKKLAEFDPVVLVGLAPPDVSRMLGQPIDTRNEAMSTEWIYTARSCSLAIFFYPDIATGALRALKYNVNAPKDGDRDCMQQFLIAKGNDHG